MRVTMIRHEVDDVRNKAICTDGLQPTSAHQQKQKAPVDRIPGMILTVVICGVCSY